MRGTGWNASSRSRRQVHLQERGPQRMSDHSMSVPPEEIRIRRGKHELLACGDLLTVGGKSFALSRVDRVAYRAATRINQAQYVIGVAQGDLKRQFLFEAFRRGTELDDTRELF